MSSLNQKSTLYYLLPAFFAIIGGVVALLILRNSDPKKGRNCIILGIIGSAIAIGYDYVAETFEITFGRNIETFGISDYMGGVSIYILPPIVIGYYVLQKMKN
ncbi:MAG: hypothetical protein MAG458_01743 [Nitrosopumilus sp.]|nr:hypothetical protein [Nitrosopumilus sp.]